MKKRVQKHLLVEQGEKRAFGKSLIHALFVNGFLETNLNKAKLLKSESDHLISLGLRGGLSAYRNIQKRVSNSKTVNSIIKYAHIVKGKRTSGFSSIKKVGFRRGDGALIAKISLIDFVSKKEIKNVSSDKQETKEVVKKQVKSKNNVKKS